MSVPTRTPSDHLRDVTDLLAAVRILDAALADRLGRLLDRLDRRLPLSDDRTVLIHGAFRPGQVIVDDAGLLYLLDLDGVCRGHAAHDLGSVSGHLSWQAVRQPGRELELRMIDEALLAGHGSRGPAVDPASLALVAICRACPDRCPTLPPAGGCALGLGPADHRPGGEPARRLADEQDAMTDVELLQSDQVTELLRAALADHTSDPARLTVVSQRELTSAAGRRRVIGYAVEGLDPTGPAQLIAKIFSESSRAQLLWTHLQVLSRGRIRGRPVPRTGAAGLFSPGEPGAVPSVYRDPPERTPE